MDDDVVRDLLRYAEADVIKLRNALENAIEDIEFLWRGNDWAEGSREDWVGDYTKVLEETK